MDGFLENNNTCRNKAESLTAVAFSRCPVPMALSDVDQRKLLEINDSLCSLLGYRQDDFLPGSKPPEIWHDNAQRDALVQQLLEGLDQVKGEVLLSRKDGALAAMLASGKMIEFSGQKYTLWLFSESEENKYVHYPSFSRSQEIAIAEERQRIAREIHDGIAQDLASLRMRTQYWKSILKNAPDKLPAEFDFLQQQLSNNIQEVRRSIFALRPLALEKEDFLGAISQYFKEFGEMNRVYTHLSIPEKLPLLPGNLELTVFRILQEALNNIAKHARAENVWVTLDTIENAYLSIVIQDDGCGFPVGETFMDQHSNRIGLRQMKTRVQEIYGTFSINSIPDEGTVIRMQVPLVKE